MADKNAKGGTPEENTSLSQKVMEICGEAIERVHRRLFSAKDISAEELRNMMFVVREAWYTGSEYAEAMSGVEKVGREGDDEEEEFDGFTPLGGDEEDDEDEDDTPPHPLK